MVGGEVGWRVAERDVMLHRQWFPTPYPAFWSSSSLFEVDSPRK